MRLSKGGRMANKRMQPWEAWRAFGYACAIEAGAFVLAWWVLHGLGWVK